MQPPSDHHSFFLFLFFFFFWYSETDSAMKKRTAESLYEMMHRIHSTGHSTRGIVKCYDVIKYYKHVMV